MSNNYSFKSHQEKLSYLFLEKIKIYNVWYSFKHKSFFEQFNKNIEELTKKKIIDFSNYKSNNCYFFKNTFEEIEKVTIVRYLFLNYDFLNTFLSINKKFKNDDFNFEDLIFSINFFNNIDKSFKEKLDIIDLIDNNDIEGILNRISLYRNPTIIFDELEKELKQINLTFFLSNDVKILISHLRFGKINFKKALNDLNEKLSKSRINLLLSNTNLESLLEEIDFYFEKNDTELLQKFYNDTFLIFESFKYLDKLSDYKKQKVFIFPMCNYLTLEKNFLYKQTLNSFFNSKEHLYRFIKNDKKYLEPLLIFKDNENIVKEINETFDKKFTYNKKFISEKFNYLLENNE